MYNVLPFKFDDRSDYSNIKASNIKLFLLNAYLLCCIFGDNACE